MRHRPLSLRTFAVVLVFAAAIGVGKASMASRGPAPVRAEPTPYFEAGFHAPADPAPAAPDEPVVTPAPAPRVPCTPPPAPVRHAPDQIAFITYSC